MDMYPKPLFILLLLGSTASAQTISSAESKQLEAVNPGPTIRILSSDSEPLRTAKAALVVPHPRQMAWQQLEFACFLHFGINTFTGNEWGHGTENTKVFDPTGVDTDQWCRSAKAAAMKVVPQRNMLCAVTIRLLWK